MKNSGRISTIVTDGKFNGYPGLFLHACLEGFKEEFLKKPLEKDLELSLMTSLQEFL